MAADNSVLHRAYRYYNRKYFKNQLPRELPVEWKRMPPTTFGYCMFEGGAPARIAINRRLDPAEIVWQMTLLHEMAHANLPSRAWHGPKFDAEMLRLARLGAFKGLW